MALRLDHVELASHEPGGLAAAYAPAGLSLSGERLDGGRGAVVLQRADRPPAPDHLRACVAGIAHVCIQSTAPQRVWDELAAQGMAWNDALVGLGTGYTYAYGYDREGNLVELEGTGEAWDGRETWLAHAAIVTPDMDRALDFYARLTGVEPHGAGRYSHPNMGRVAALDRVDARAAWLATPGLTLELWQYIEPATEAAQPGRPTGYRRLGFTCDDLDAVRARLAALGVATREAEGGLLGEDPDGNPFRILARAPAGRAAA